MGYNRLKKRRKEAAGRITDDLEKVCVLMWDEVALSLHVQYCPEKDKVVGVEVLNELLSMRITH